MRKLRIPSVYLLSKGFFLCVIPGLRVGVGHLQDGVLRLRETESGTGTVALAGLAIGFGLFLVAWSRYWLGGVGKGHPQEAFGVSPRPGSANLVTDRPLRCSRNPGALGYLVAPTLGSGVTRNSPDWKSALCLLPRASRSAESGEEARQLVCSL